MTYHLGVDLGTTYTAAATYQDGRVEIAQLGERGPTAASVVGITADGGVLAGDAANRQALTEPQRVVREFKRRLGDTTPVMVGGAPVAPEQLSAQLLRWVCETVGAAKGRPPASVALTHPANWGPFKRDLLTQAAQASGLPGVTLVAEPQAAAIHYASQERVEPGSVVAVYDLGGGTFDVAILRKEPDGNFTMLGSPEGIERLGGVDVDEAVFARIQAHLEDEFQSLDPDDPGAVAAISRLRQECTQAKEALSLDNEVTIPVLLPNVHTEVRLTRVELEDMIRPLLGETLTALERALRSASMSAGQISRVLLVGGSSRIPLVGEMISAQVGRPVGVDTHPKHAVALGAALAAARAAGIPIADPAAGPGPGAAPAAVGAPAGAAMGAGAASATMGPTPPPEASGSPPPPGPPPGQPAVPGQAPPPPGPPQGGPGSSPPAAAPPPGAAPPPPGFGAPPPAPGAGGSGDPTFDAAPSEPPAPSLGYPPAATPPSPGPAGMPPPPGAAVTELPPGWADDEQKAKTRRKARRRNRLSALVALIVVLVALGATFVIKAISEKKLTLADMEVGECFVGDPNDLDVVECSESHTGELIAVIDTSEEFPTHPGEGSQEEVHNTMTEKCGTKMEEYFGGTMDDVANVGATVFTYVPTVDHYEKEQFETFCVGGAVEEGQSINESFEGKGAEGGGGSGGGEGGGEGGD